MSGVPFVWVLEWGLPFAEGVKVVPGSVVESVAMEDGKVALGLDNGKTGNHHRPPDHPIYNPHSLNAVAYK